jgi:deoxyribodipyrimidine photo-lyase
MKKAIVWFKTDLRLQDNETLMQAIAQSEEIIPIYCLDENHFRTTDFGFKKMGGFRTQFLIEALIDLDKNLRALGSGLMILKGKPEVVIAELVKQLDVKRVFAKKEVAFEELETQNKVEVELWKLNCFIETYSTSTLYHAQDLPFALKDIPDIFTKFRKRIEQDAEIKNTLSKPANINSPNIQPIETNIFDELKINNITMDSRAAILFKGGETEAWKRLDHYFFQTKSLTHYKETRNGLIGNNYSTKLSVWLALGCISARSIYAEVKKYENEVIVNDSTYWLVFELIWRDYFRFMMKKYQHLYFLKNGIKATEIELNSHQPDLFEKWKTGQTGNDFIDANMRELNLTGYMSNRGRQNVASYLCNDLNLDWRYGAAYFEQQLIDYDVCSNWGNWAYIAGVGNDPREKRVFNTEKQAYDYDKNKTYRNLWLNNI